MNSTITVANGSMFAEGDIVEIGMWPMWMVRWQLDPWIRRAIQWTCKLFGKNFGPRQFRIGRISHGI